jgi:hypothetical protein
MGTSLRTLAAVAGALVSLSSSARALAEGGPPAAAGSPAPAPVAPSPPAPQGALIHIWSDNPSLLPALYRVVGTVQMLAPTSTVGPGSQGGAAMGRALEPTSGVIEGSVNQLVCFAPCDAKVGGLSGEFFLGGEGIASSRHLQLDLRPRRVDLMASPQSTSRLTAGTTLLTLGIVSSIVGTIFIGFAVGNSDVGIKGTVAGLLVGGTAMIGGGIPLLVTGHSKLTLGAPGVALRF